MCGLNCSSNDVDFKREIEMSEEISRIDLDAYNERERRQLWLSEYRANTGGRLLGAKQAADAALKAYDEAFTVLPDTGIVIHTKDLNIMGTVINVVTGMDIKAGTNVEIR